MSKERKPKTGLGASLKPKSDIKKSDKDISDISEKVARLHAQEAKPKKDAYAFFQVRMDKEEHKQLKLYCVQNGVMMRDFVNEAIREKGEDLGIF